MKSNESFWLFIHPYVFVSHESRALRCMLYNTQSGERVETSDLQAMEIVKQMHKKTSLGTFLLHADQFPQDTLHFINECIEKAIFGVEPFVASQRRPIQLMPILNVQKDVDRLKKSDDRSIGENVLSYLRHLSLYVVDDCHLHCDHCLSLYKQLRYCTCGSKKTMMSLSMLQKIAHQVMFAPLVQIDIMGGDIFLHPELEKFVDMLEKHAPVIQAWTYYRNYKVNELQVSFDIWVDTPVDIDVLKRCLDFGSKQKQRFHFLVKSLSDIEQVESVMTLMRLQNADMQPFFTGQNIDFFRDQVFLNREDIFDKPISQRQVFCNQTLNTNDFGHLVVVPSGEVRANMNAPLLGDIKVESILDLIYKELDINTAWRKTRIASPCSECLYQYLCPPPSNYEFVIGKANLCTVNPNVSP